MLPLLVASFISANGETAQRILELTDELKQRAVRCQPLTKITFESAPAKIGTQMDVLRADQELVSKLNANFAKPNSSECTASKNSSMSPTETRLCRL